MMDQMNETLGQDFDTAGGSESVQTDSVERADISPPGDSPETQISVGR